MLTFSRGFFAHFLQACSGLLLKVNQIGTITESIAACKMAQKQVLRLNRGFSARFLYVCLYAFFFRTCVRGMRLRSRHAECNTVLSNRFCVCFCMRTFCLCMPACKRRYVQLWRFNSHGERDREGERECVYMYIYIYIYVCMYVCIRILCARSSARCFEQARSETNTCKKEVC
jgi:hypothetical protein